MEVENSSLIIVGSGLKSLAESVGSYAVLFMGARLIFDNSSCALQAYTQLKGEAYLWDMNGKAGVSLIEAKLFNSYNTLENHFQHESN